MKHTYRVTMVALVGCCLLAGFATSVQAQLIQNVEPVGMNTYSIYISDVYPQNPGLLKQYFMQAAQSTCQGAYSVLEQCYTSDQIIGVVECQQQSFRQAPTPMPPQPQQPQPQQPQRSSPTPTYTQQRSSSQLEFQNMQFGLGGGLNIPFDDAGEFLDISPSFHGTMLLRLRYDIALEGDLSWWLFNMSGEQTPEKNFDMSLLALAGGGRYYFSPQFHVDVGLGFYRFAWEYDKIKLFDDDIHEEDNKLELGLYAGVGYEIGPFDMKVRLHKSEFYILDFWDIGMYGTYLF